MTDTAQIVTNLFVSFFNGAESARALKHGLRYVSHKQMCQNSSICLELTPRIWFWHVSLDLMMRKIKTPLWIVKKKPTWQVVRFDWTRTAKLAGNRYSVDLSGFSVAGDFTDTLSLILMKKKVTWFAPLSVRGEQSIHRRVCLDLSANNAELFA